MPETITEPQPPLAVPIKDVIGNVFDGVFDDKPASEPPAKEAPPPKQEKAEKVEKPKEEPASGFIPDNLFGEPEKEKTVIEKANDLAKEPVKEEAPAELKGKARENFQRLSDKAFQAEVKAREVEAKLAKAEERLGKGDPDAKARIETLERQLAQYDGIVSRANVELTPRFQREITIPRQQALEYAKQAMKDAGADPDALEVAVGLKGAARVAKLDEIMSEINSPFQQGKVKDAVLAIERLDTRRDRVLSDHKTWLAEEQKNEAANRHKTFEQFERETLSNLDEARRVLAEEHKLVVFRKSNDPKAKEWNDAIDNAHEQAKQIMLKTDNAKQMAIAAELAAAFPLAYSGLLKERELRLKAEKKLKEYEDSEPGLGGERTDETGGSSGDDTDWAESIVKGLHKRHR